MTRAIFTSTSVFNGAPGYPERSGEVVEVVRPLTMGDATQGAEVDTEVGKMFRIRFADGVEADAFEDELEEVTP